jgi:hypothetical protein
MQTVDNAPWVSMSLIPSLASLRTALTNAILNLELIYDEHSIYYLKMDVYNYVV